MKCSRGCWFYLFSPERLIFLFNFSAFCEGRPNTHHSWGWPSSSSHSTGCYSLEANRNLVSLWELPAELWTLQYLPSLFLPSQECTAAKKTSWTSHCSGFGTVLEDCHVEWRLSSQQVLDSQMLNKQIWMMFTIPALGARVRAVCAELSTSCHRGYTPRACHQHPLVPCLLGQMPTMLWWIINVHNGLLTIWFSLHTVYKLIVSSIWKMALIPVHMGSLFPVQSARSWQQWVKTNE